MKLPYGAPSPDYWCANCEAARSLNRHARCQVCDSDAVDLLVRPLATVQGLASAYLVAADLEALYTLEGDGKPD